MRRKRRHDASNTDEARVSLHFEEIAEVRLSHIDSRITVAQVSWHGIETIAYSLRNPGDDYSQIIAETLAAGRAFHAVGKELLRIANTEIGLGDHMRKKRRAETDSVPTLEVAIIKNGKVRRKLPVSGLGLIDLRGEASAWLGAELPRFHEPTKNQTRLPVGNAGS